MSDYTRAEALTALAQAKAYKPRDDHGRRMKALNVRQIEDYIRERWAGEVTRP